MCSPRAGHHYFPENNNGLACVIRDVIPKQAARFKKAEKKKKNACGGGWAWVTFERNNGCNKIAQRKSPGNRAQSSFREI